MSVIIAHKGTIIARDFMTSYPSGEPAWKPGIEVPDGAAIGFQWTNSIAPLMGFLSWNARKTPKDIRVVLPFMPCSRQDKLIDGFAGDQSAGIGPIVELLLLKAQNDVISHITTLDVHSNVVIPDDADLNRSLLNYAQPKMRFSAVVAPDKGARARAQAVADLYNLPVICANKARDQATGKILGLSIDKSQWAGDSAPEAVLVVDDILDGGYTFELLAEVLDGLWPSTRRYLMCTHGVLSWMNSPEKFDPDVLKYYERILLTDSCKNAVQLARYPSNRIEIIPVVERMTIERSLA